MAHFNQMKAAMRDQTGARCHPRTASVVSRYGEPLTGEAKQHPARRRIASTSGTSASPITTSDQVVPGRGLPPGAALKADPNTGRDKAYYIWGRHSRR
jgi:hypothetical protein